MSNELIALLRSKNNCPACRKERKTFLFEGEKFRMCLSCYTKKIFKDFDPAEIEYNEYAKDTGGKPYRLTETAKWYRKFYKDILWNGKDDVM